MTPEAEAIAELADALPKRERYLLLRMAQSMAEWKRIRRPRQGKKVSRRKDLEASPEFQAAMARIRSRM